MEANMKGKISLSRFVFVLILGLLLACSSQPKMNDLAGEWVVDEDKAVEMLRNIEELVGEDLGGKSEEEVKELVIESQKEKWVLFESVDANTMKISWVDGSETASTETIRLVKREQNSFSFAGSRDPDDVATITFLDRNRIRLADDAGEFTVYFRRK
jgi:hypothetical protein